MRGYVAHQWKGTGLGAKGGGECVVTGGWHAESLSINTERKGRGEARGKGGLH